MCRQTPIGHFHTPYGPRTAAACAFAISAVFATIVPYLLSTGRENRALPEKLSPHLQDLESEAIYIICEAAEVAKPVLLYSIGKDSSVLLHLARKPFFPVRPPFPLLHIDTRWKFREMIACRDATAKRLDLDLIVYVHEYAR